MPLGAAWAYYSLSKSSCIPLVRHCKYNTLCFCLGGSRQSLKVREVKCILRDPTLMCPVLFKGSHSLLSLALALCSLLYVASLSRKAVLNVLLAVLCYACGYGIICPSSCFVRVYLCLL